MTTIFKSAKQTTQIHKPGKLSQDELSSIGLVSEQGEKLAKNSAPRSGFSKQFTDKGQPAADRLMAGDRSRRRK